RTIRQTDRCDILDPVDSRTGPHIASNELPSGKQPSQVGVPLLTLNLVRAELENGFGALKDLGGHAAKRLVVVGHWRGSSLGREGARGCSLRGVGAQAGSTPSVEWMAADHKRGGQNGQAGRTGLPRLKTSALAAQDRR